MSQNNIFSQLKSEHEELKSLLKKAEDCSEDQRSEILEEIEKELVPHARGEEKTLYALMKERAEAKDKDESLDLVNEAYEEHRVADNLMADLKAMDVSEDTWLAHLKVIKENLEHHIEEEEDDLFPKAKKLLSEEEQNELLDAYLSEKEKFSVNLPTQGHIRERSAASSLNHLRT